MKKVLCGVLGVGIVAGVIALVARLMRRDYVAV